MKQVVGARLAGKEIGAERTPDSSRVKVGREVRAIPGQAAMEVQIEVVNFLGERLRYRRMLIQIRIERRGARLLRADDQKIRQDAERRSAPPKLKDGAA